MKVWITKYALTIGIEEKEGEKTSASEDGICITSENYPIGQYYYGKDWYENKEEAVKRAEEMRLKKIKSLKKQIEKLEQMKFE